MAIDCTIFFVLNQVISRPRRTSSRPQEDLDPGLSVKKAEVPLPRLRGARPSTGLGSATTPAPLLVATSHLPATTWRKLHTPSMPSTPKLSSSKRTRWSGLVCSSEIYLQCQYKQCDSSQSGCAWFKESSRYKPHKTSLPQIYITPLALKWVIGQMQNLSKRDSLSEMQLWTQNEGKSESQESSDWLVANRREGGPAAPFDTLTTVGRLLLVPFLPFLFTSFSLFFYTKKEKLLNFRMALQRLFWANM